ncbi:hypothetical protein QCA50_011572 [Cerrena zonata]|uniref:Uncharacterized protein n=1 Tax=Cerrena zonata TaxID=2478898 RepID=A0AAW0G4I3_9APHY
MSSSEQDTLSHFAALDELIQLIYQGAHKFVVISSVGQLSWDVHLGLTGPDGRWWKGKWTEKDIQQFVGNAASSFVMESFAEKLAQAIVQGDLQVGDWNPERGTSINLTLGPTAKNPIRVPLTELTAQEAASYATRVFSEIAMQAQPRKCRMNSSDDMPSIVNTSTIRRTSPIATSSKHRIDPESPPKPAKRTSLGRTVTLT